MVIKLKVVLKLTGKIFDDENAEVLRNYSEIIRERFRGGDRFAIVCGGGPIARQYIKILRKLGVGEGWSDIIGIEVSRINATVINSLLSDIAYRSIPRSVEDFLRAWSSEKVVTLGGLQPGQSTNAVAMIIAELIDADLMINATDVDGVFDKDPKECADAKLIPKITIGELKKVIKGGMLAGSYELFDQLALAIAERSRIKLYFVNAFKPHNVSKLLEGCDFLGTEVIYPQ